ncbi:MAG TPA: bifunctional metallophosphatase/5'-nucleotidase [Gaiellaceae bacterium]|nr:bifunctional metallophosphatase/5'-nucleotidase [Gaiellaceae bacterium]
MKLRSTLLAVVALALAIVAAPTALAADGPKKEKLTHVKLLAFNDFHGHLEPGTPGTISVGATQNPTTGVFTPINVPAGGAEYFATHMKALGSEAVDTYVVSAGDLIGASPLASGLMHDEPTIDVMNYIGLDTIGVGNHEFDEGKSELLRMQYGNAAGGGGTNGGTAYVPARPDGCHPVDGCQDGTPFFGSVFQYLAANVIDQSTNNPLLPAYRIVNTSTGEKIAFVGETLQGTPLIVTPTGVAGLTFLDEADTVNALVSRLKQRQVSTIVLLLHEGGAQTAPFSRGFMDVNKCENFSGPDLLDIVNRLDPAVDVVVSAHTHQPYVCRFNGRLVTSAASFGRLITSIDLTIDQRAGKMISATAVNNVVTQTVAKDEGVTKILAEYKKISDPIGNRVIGRITQDIYSARGTVNGTNRAGEQPMGDVIADAMYEAAHPGDFGGAVAAFMNSGGVRSSLLYGQISGGEQPGEVTYAEAFAVQPFGNTLVVKTCTGQQLYDVLEQQFENPAAGQQRVMLVSQVTYTYTRSVPPGQKRVLDGSLKIGGVVVNKTTGYRVVMNNFMADGGDGYSVFKSCTNPLGGEVDIDAFGRYLLAHSPVAPPVLDRIKRTD